jgi:maltose alpha-D-glucosyltransferase / alpha-amylase
MTHSSAPAPESTAPAVSTDAIGPQSLWYKDAVFYEVHVRAFRDSSGDGVGDFHGLTEKLDYLQALGVTTIWLLPFFPSPLKDDGYDISDYTGVHPDYGTIEDFAVFLQEAHHRGLRVVIELVLNHTSDQHAWFQRARLAPPGSPERDFYVWSETPDVYSDARIIFKDFELSNWTWDPVARAYFWHRFYSHQPDLNYGNPLVIEAITGVIDFWFDLGVDGLRLDAVPYLAEAEGTSSENLPETHSILKMLRQHIDKKYRDRILLAEANQWPEDAAAYFGTGDECNMAFHFPLMPRLFVALRQEDAFPVMDILSQTPRIPDTCQWALFLRNHDELTLEMVTEEERLFMWNAYARDPQARINLGIRRRLAPLLRNDRRRIELMNALLLSMPGTPVLYYGDEIGMGDNIYLGDRNGVRTPMQWNPGLNAGFSEANPQRLYLPVIIDPEYHHIVVQVENQALNPHSILNWMRRILAVRKQHRALGRGTLEFLETNNSHTLAYQRRYEDETLLIVANLSRFAQHFAVQLGEHAGMVPFDLFSRSPFPSIGADPYPLTLGPHGFVWLSIQKAPDESRRAGPEDYEAPLVTVTDRWDELLFGAKRVQLEQMLPGFLRLQTWFHGVGKTVLACTIQSMLPVSPEGEPDALFLATIRVDFSQGDPEVYVLPLQLDERQDHLPEDDLCPAVARLAVAGPQGKSAVLRDAAFDPRLVKALLRLVLEPGELSGPLQSLQVLRTPVAETLGELDIDAAEVSPAPSTLYNSIAVVGGRAVLKLFRRVQEGVNPDLELTLFVSQQGFPNAPAVAGALQQPGTFRESVTLAVVSPFVPNQGTSWEHSLAALEAYVQRAGAGTQDLASLSISPRALFRALPHAIPQQAHELIGEYLDEMALLGTRTGELHAALSSDRQHPSLAPEQFTEFYQRSLYQRFRVTTIRTFDRLAAARRKLPKPLSGRIAKLLSLRDPVLASYEILLHRHFHTLRIRCHGNLHLENVLRVDDDFMFVDFEGEPNLPLYERRLKASPLTDAVSLVRSIHYVPQAHLLPLATEEQGGQREGRLQTAVRYWQHWGSVSLLQGYSKAAGSAGLLPPPEDFEHLLSLLFTARAVYELAYEQTYRPEWLAIPLDDLLEIAQEAG